MSDNEGENTSSLAKDFNFDNWCAELGLSRKVSQILRQEDITTERALSLIGYRDLRELNIPLGAAKVIADCLGKWKQTPTETGVEDASRAKENGNAKDDALFGAGKTLDILLQSSQDTLVTPAQPVSTSDHMMDPRSVLTIKATSKKTVHITQFLTEKCKRRRLGRNKQFVIRTASTDSEAILLKTDDDHPYLGLYIEEWGAANMRLMNHLLVTNCLSREDVEYYLAYTTKIFEFAEIYDWNSVLHFDFTYRELQAQHGFKWGTFSPHMELQLLIPKSTRKQQTKGKDNYNHDNVEDCRIFKAKGTCPFGQQCRYRHPKRQQKRDDQDDTRAGKNA